MAAMTAILPDAAPDNWVDRYAPAGLRPWLKLGRFDRPAGIWLLIVPGLARHRPGRHRPGPLARSGLVDRLLRRRPP